MENPKEAFLSKINQAVYEFERKTGCEVVIIEIDRSPVRKQAGGLVVPSVVANYELELR